MCGIAGLVMTRPGLQPAEATLRAMIGSLHHRGPDGSRVQVDGPVGLAHARLSIIDLEGGWQPVHNEDDSVRVIFNGEIFNHVELRAELQAQGHRFYTRSDTEVLVHLYDQHGDDFLTRLNGQFALILHDRRQRRVLVARDRVGIRPVFYTLLRDGIALASEVKALFALPEVPRRIDPLGLAETFTFWSPIGTRSAFTGIAQLPPGHRMVIDLARPVATPRTEAWWDWCFPAADEPGAVQDEARAADELHALLVDAVRLQLRADVPVGAYLSGGLDSSVITTLIRHYTDTPLRSFSLGFEAAEFDERAHQRALVAHLGTTHSEIVVSRGAIAGAFARAVWHAEAPLVRTAPAPMMLLAAHVREQGYKVVLTGEGADEVFAGYDLFKEAAIRRFMARQPGSAWRGRLLQRLYPYLQTSPGRGRALAESFFSADAGDPRDPWYAHATRMRSTQRIWNFLHPDVRREIDGWDARMALATGLPAGFARWNALARDQYVEAHTLLPGYLLSAQGDRMAMAHSIEARFPFLDHRVIEFANRLPPGRKLRGLAEKRILRLAMARDLPAAIGQRTKQPYRSPDSACFFEDQQALPWVAELLSPQRLADAGLFDAPAVARLVEKCRTGRAIGFPDNMAFVGVLSTMLLHAQHVRGLGPTAFA